MIESIEVAQGILIAARDVVPAHPKLRAAWIARPIVSYRNRGGVCGRRGPALIEQRRPAGREPWLPDQVDGVAAAFVGEPHCINAEKICAHNVHKILRRKAVCRVKDIGLAPADELPASLQGQTAAGKDKAEASRRKRWPQSRSIIEVHA